jgi:hypothetical protein
MRLFLLGTGWTRSRDGQRGDGDKREETVDWETL